MTDAKLAALTADVNSDYVTARDGGRVSWDDIDAVADALAVAPRRGSTPSVVGRKARVSTTTAYRALEWLVDQQSAHTSGNGTWTRYHPGRK